MVNLIPAGRSSVAEVLASQWLLPAAVLLALVMRVGWALSHGLAIEQEGAEYARIAENLLAGNGYVGMFNAGVQLNFPPLYPLMIAVVTLIVGNAELAARAINIALGAALVIPMFRLAEMLHGRKVAVTTAVLVALHPVLIAGAASTYSEGPYLTLVMFAMLWLARWVIHRRVSASIATGVLFGLAYLIRPEAFLLAGLATVGGFIATMFVMEGRRTIVGSLALLCAFSVVAAPNVAFLTYSTGKLRIEAKGTLAYHWGQRINQGMSYLEAANGIGQDLSDQGAFMRPNLDVIQSTSYSLREYAEFVVSAAQKNVGKIVRTVTGEPSFGSPWLFALVVLGLFRSAWTRQRLSIDGLLVVYALVSVLVLLTVQALWFRYFYSVLGMMLFWAAKGADELSDWSRATVRSIAGRDTIARAAGEGLKWLVLVFVLLGSLRNIVYVSQFGESLNRERKEAGLWLAQQAPGHKWVMDLNLQVAYYAGADLMYLPYADADLALRYIVKRNPDYIVLTGGGQSDVPYTGKWFSEGIPSPSAQLIYDQPRSGGERIKIYRWAPSITTTN